MDYTTIEIAAKILRLVVMVMAVVGLCVAFFPHEKATCPLKELRLATRDMKLYHPSIPIPIVGLSDMKDVSGKVDIYSDSRYVTVFDSKGLSYTIYLSPSGFQYIRIVD